MKNSLYVRNKTRILFNIVLEVLANKKNVRIQDEIEKTPSSLKKLSVFVVEINISIGNPRDSTLLKLIVVFSKVAGHKIDTINLQAFLYTIVTKQGFK